MTSVTVSIVLHNSAVDIASCLTAVARQLRAPDDIVVLDNASADGGLAVAERAMPGIRLIQSRRNMGFAGGQNRAMAAAPADVHVVLNPDCQLHPTFINTAIASLERRPDVGSLTGRLLRFHPGYPDTDQPMDELPDDILDSTGMLGLRNRRVLDRGSDRSAAGQYLRPAYVFGASGAAAVYRRKMLDDVSVDGQPFDEAFHAYREDVDLAWRAQLRGWCCLYEPDAMARHRRRVAPGRRRLLPAVINRLSIANRWRMIAKNETNIGWARDWPAMIGRDALTIGYCALREQSSLAAIGEVFRDRHRLRRWRRQIMSRRTADAESVADWFGRREESSLPPDGGL